MVKPLKTVFLTLVLAIPIFVAALPDDIEKRVSNPRPTTILRVPSLTATATCPGTPLSCQPTQFATSYVTSGTVLITTTVTTVLTSVYDHTVTLPTTVPIAHSCFTYLIATPQSNNEFCGPFTSKCGPTKKCTVTSTTTGACKDPCCTCTPILPTLGGCKTACSTGCATTWATIAQTAGCPA